MEFVEKETVEQITDKILSKGWNRTYKEASAALIASHILPTKSFDSLIEYLKKEKERQGVTDFNTYYGRDLIELLEMLPNNQQGIEDFYNEMKKNFYYRGTKFSNFDFLLENNLVALFSEFSKYNGDIQKLHQIDGITIIESSRKGGVDYYLANKDNTDLSHYCFNSIRNALIFAIFGELHFSTLTILHDAIKEGK